MIFLLNKHNSVATNFIAELRDVAIQQDSMRFRRNMERLGEIFAYEISKSLPFVETQVETTFGTATIPVFTEQPVLATILRAGLPLHQGLLNYFDKADSAFISAYRKVKKNGEFIVKTNYVSSPELTDKVVIMADPMLATGSSMVLCCKELLAQYKFKMLHIVSVIASAEGVQHVRANFPNAHLWIGAVDEEMTTKSYIVPGLGDAGDLAYGVKDDK